MQAFVHHEDTLICSDNIRPSALQHGHVGPVLLEILRDVVSAIPCADDNNLLPLDVVL